MKPTAVDLFSGSGMFSLAAEAAGFNVLAHCECDPFAVTLLAHRFPKTPIFTEIRKITKENFYERTGRRTVDVVCGGSPCQDLSIAGKQRGLAGERSGLFYEQMRIARELSAKYVVWENVPGALSSNRGRDFAAILGEFTGRDVGDFLDGSGAARWGNAGAFRARTECDFSVIYRILDTRFFGIPQRRRRIYIVARLGTECRPEILFEPYGVRRHFEARGEAREGIAAVSKGGIGSYDRSSQAATLRISGDVKGGGGTLIAAKTAATIDCSYAKQQGCDNQHVDAGCPNFVFCFTHGASSTLGIRRLTPVECERLQGMPDNWTKVLYRGKPADKCPDGPRYKVCGNAVTKDAAEFVCLGVHEDFMKEAANG